MAAGSWQGRVPRAELPLPTRRRRHRRSGQTARHQQLVAAEEPPPPAAARPRPFLKWAGGKRRLLPEIEAVFPPKFGRYIEPFLGGGAVMFHVLSGRPGTACLASDSNPELVDTYEAIRDGVERLILILERHAKRYADGGSDYYYEVRAESPAGKAERAARMLFLNRTCFNGLYRVNGSGRFNVPFGGYRNPAIVNAAVLRAASALLSSAAPSLSCRDFEETVAEASGGDLVYMDPPYQPASPTASFTHYTRADFGRDDLERLAAACRRLDGRGCRVVLSNSDTPEVRRLFGGGGWKRTRLAVNRVINSDGTKRRGHSELLIRNF